MSSTVDITRLWNYRVVQTRREERDAQARRFNEATAAETRLAERVKAECGYDGIRMRVRVPRYRREDDTSGRGEIDMILVNKNGIYVIEIKDFYGQVYSSGDKKGNYTQWIQKGRNSDSGGKIYLEHGDLLGEITLKAKALGDYLLRTPIPSFVEGMFENNQDGAMFRSNEVRERKRLPLPPGKIFPCLVFVNPHCVVDPQTLMRHDYVFTPESFVEFVGKRSAAWDWTSWMLPMIVPNNQLSHNNQLAALAILDTLPTWDTITFHNGSVRTGDIESIHFPEEATGSASNPVYPSIERRFINEIFMTWPGLSFMGLVWTLCTRLNLPTVYLRLKPTATIDVQFPKMRKYVLTGKEADAASKNALANNEGGSSHATRRSAVGQEDSNMGSRVNGMTSQMKMLSYPIGNKPGEPMRSRNVVHIKFKSAGQTESEYIALHHLSSISLSPVSVHSHGRGAGALPGDARR